MLHRWRQGNTPIQRNPYRTIGRKVELSRSSLPTYSRRTSNQTTNGQIFLQNYEPHLHSLRLRKNDQIFQIRRSSYGNFGQCDFGYVYTSPRV